MTKRSLQVFAAAVVGVGLASASEGAIIQDFNVNEGLFNLQPSFAGQSNVATSSTADRVTTGSFEGAGNEQLVLNLNTANPARVRFLYNGGTPHTSAMFTTSAGTDGFIGFYYKTSDPGITLGINLDDSTNTGAGMDMGALKTVIADGQWHLAEWSLDDDAQWVAVSGIGGDGTIQDGQHSLDSIYIQNITANSTISFDFVAYNPTGSIAALVPEPASLSLLALSGLFIGRRRRA